MTILVTRPSPAGEQLVSQLLASGRPACHTPLIDFSSGRDLPNLPNLLQSLQSGDYVFLLSRLAVHYANTGLKDNKQPWPDGLTWYAIGRSTALALHAVSGLKALFPQPKETSEALLMLPAMHKVNGKNALLLRGNGGRELLGKKLTARGAHVICCECYRRNAIDYDGYLQSRLWQAAGVDTLVVTSGEMLQQLYTLVPDDWRSDWLLRCQLIVVSDRLATLARLLGWSTIRVAANADNGALLRALQ